MHLGSARRRVRRTLNRLDDTDYRMSLVGQNAKYSSGTDVFRSTPENGLKSDITPRPFRAITGSGSLILRVH
jgi:hypothetical protein